MEKLGFQSKVYHGELYLGELQAIPVIPAADDASVDFRFPNDEIRISDISPSSERCSPLSILQSASPFAVRCKLESTLPPEQQPHLLTLHASCFYELRTAVVVLGDEEMHLVAMPSKQKKFPCFWCYLLPSSLYNSCLAMLNLRCLSIVFDLDETLIVANTMKSFEDKIDQLKGWISRETNPVRLSGMSAELKRYADDRVLLKQYIDYDCVIDGGKPYKTLSEEVPRLSDSDEKIFRPVIRLQDRNVVLTRINPEIRDTSVLVRLRPAWEELRSYLKAKGRKRFEVFVCTMAERDYALEMWRLLDPEAHLIGSKELLGRVVCVKSGARKSLLNVFKNGLCHPNMAMVIDDRAMVWEENDQARVHVVPAFTPYYAPQAEMANTVPVLCVARNVACNVRGGFFKEFDEIFLRRISELFYEDDVSDLSSPPDVCNYLKEDIGVPNGNANFGLPEGVDGAELGWKLHPSEETNTLASSAVYSTGNGLDVRSSILKHPVDIASPGHSRILASSQKPSLLGVPSRRDNVSSDSDIDGKRKPLMARQANSISPEPPVLKLPMGTLSMSKQSKAGWLMEDDTSRGHLNQIAQGSGQGPAVLRTRTEEASPRHVMQKPNLVPLPANPLRGGTRDISIPQNQVYINRKEFQPNVLKTNVQQNGLSISVLQEIGRRCSCKVEFRPVISRSKDLQFTVEVFFTGEKIGIGMGKTRKDAQLQAAENALHSLADHYLACMAPRNKDNINQDVEKLSISNENGFIWDEIQSEHEELTVHEKMSKERSAEGVELRPGASSLSLTNQPSDKPNNSSSSSGDGRYQLFQPLYPKKQAME
ncbi:hypothetical protein Droror1_Dr00025845 [Drosera rotundifolia]